MKYLIFLLFSFIILTTSTAQEIGYEIRPTYRKAIKKEILEDARNLSDINPDFPSSWVKKYHNVKITATSDGSLVSIESEDDHLNDSQMRALKNADFGSDINVSVKYNPKNSDENNIREINFTYSIVPETEARFSEDYQDLKTYIKTHVIDKLSKDKIEGLESAIVRFTIGDEGKPINPVIELTSKNKEIDQLLIDMVTNMPNWKPAARKDGSKIKQDFILSVGSIIGC